MAAIGVQQQRIPMVDPSTGMITKEWLKILGGAAAATSVDVTALSAALDAAVARIATLESQMAALTARVQALEAVDVMQFDELVIQDPSVPTTVSETILQQAPGAALSDMVLQPGASDCAVAEMVMQP